MNPSAPLRAPRPGYTCRLASSSGEIEAALRLRYEVFNRELHEGLEASHATGLDWDAFDGVMDHLIVLDNASGDVVGTYRMQTGAQAARNLGYYSEREFDLSPFEPVRNELVELGRACVHRDHRTISTVSLLWREILRYARTKGARYLMGCSSLTSQDAALGHAMYRKFASSALAPAEFRTLPQPGWELPPSADVADCGPPPRLLRAYLAVGACICGPPAIDREFGTIDFLTLLDSTRGTEIATEHFLNRLGDSSGE